jgi:hypothetical protein
MATYTELTVSVPESITFYADGTADVFRQSGLTGKCHVAKMVLTQAQFEAWHNTGRLIQEVLPHLNKDEREFFLTGSTPGEWDEAFGGDE